MNFSEEDEYKAEYEGDAGRREAAGPVPCLHRVTGCSGKREQVLLLSKLDAAGGGGEDGSGRGGGGGGDTEAMPMSSPLPPLTITIASMPTDITALALERAASACEMAERLLSLSIVARVPVPLGSITGVWHLYCPSYAATHVDMYGSGQRTLRISSTADYASGTSANAYTASLYLPPRSMPFIVRPFEAPPHASFRSTRLVTAAEGYVFEVVFLGNGYCKAWIDMQELLVGKKMEGKGGKWLKMEFWGVKEGATAWVDEVDELEVEGRRLCRKYDGE